mgnify:CR=1 FL=1
MPTMMVCAPGCEMTKRSRNCAALSPGARSSSSPAPVTAEVRPGRRQVVDAAQDALPLAAATADGLQAHPVVGVLLIHAGDGLLHRGAQRIDGVQIHALVIARRQHLVRRGLEVVVEGLRV